MKSYIEKLVENSLIDLHFPPTKTDIKIPSPEFGDYTTNVPLVLGKILKLKPQELAIKLIIQIKKLDVAKNFEEITELNGFVNFKLSSKRLLDNLHDIQKQNDSYGQMEIGQNKVVVLDLFQNNVAKPPHIGHLRSAVIGDCITRVFKLLGFKTLTDTHIGDWGTQFGILIYAFKLFGNKEAIEKDPINELNKLYVEMNNRIEKEPELREKGKAEFKKLEDGDKENRKLWEWFVKESLKDFSRYGELLGLLPFDYNLGESFYEDKMSAIVEEFKKKNILTTGETGEIYVDLDKYGLGRCIIIKADGATTYHLRDIAAYIYRKKTFNFYKNLYFVDIRQSHHFNQLFKVLELAGYPAQEDSIHVAFGFMSLPEGAISTRKGNTISLEKLVKEAQSRALDIIKEKNPTLKDKEAVSVKIGLGAIKYFDLSHNRKSELVFEWDKALAFEGNTGPYLQYTYARIQGILRKNKYIPTEVGDTLLTKQELDILRKLHQFTDILQVTAEDYMPNYLCNYLFELAQIFNAFYQNTNILHEENATIKSFRLQLVIATAQVIRNGLRLLGIETPEEI